MMENPVSEKMFVSFYMEILIRWQKSVLLK